LCKIPRDAATQVGLMKAASGFSALDSMAEVAEGLVGTSVQLAKDSICFSMDTAGSLLERAGAKKGNSHHLIKDYLRKQEGLNLDSEFCDTILAVARTIAVARPLGVLLVTDPMELARSIVALARDQEEKEKVERSASDEGHVRHPHRGLQIVPEAENDSAIWGHLMAHAMAAYGPVAIDAFGVNKKQSNLLNNYEKGIQALTEVSSEDILKIHTANGLYVPAHYLAVDHRLQKVILSIRGTWCLEDLAVDLTCEPEEMAPEEWQSSNIDDDQLKTGHVHGGFWIAAKRLAGMLESDLEKALEDNPDYSLAIVGHSYGGAIAALLCIFWSASEKGTHRAFKHRKLHAYAFGAPCVVCQNISRDEWVQKRVTSIVLGSDLVCRLGLKSFLHLQEELLVRSRVNGCAEECRSQVSCEQLFCPGKVWFLHPSSMNPVRVDPVASEYLNTIQLTRTMLSDHMPASYAEAIGRIPGINSSHYQQGSGLFPRDL